MSLFTSAFKPAQLPVNLEEKKGEQSSQFREDEIMAQLYSNRPSDIHPVLRLYFPCSVFQFSFLVYHMPSKFCSPQNKETIRTHYSHSRNCCAETCIFQTSKQEERAQGSQDKLWMTGNALKIQAVVMGFQSFLRNLEISRKSTRKS